MGRVIETTSPQPKYEARMEINNNSDMKLLGNKCLVIHDFNLPVDVSAYDPTSGSQECATITGATAYVQLVTG